MVFPAVTADDLDNDDVILAVENIPTYKRTKRNIEDIKLINAPKVIAREEEEPKEPINGVINFR